jgi:predicted N-acetyltransferase YhbS
MTLLTIQRSGAVGSIADGRRELTSEQPGDRVAVDALIARAFGPGRLAKTAERLRERADFHPELSVCGWSAGSLMGAVRLWAMQVGSAPVLFLGPIAVERACRGQGLGSSLVQEALRRARHRGEAAIILVGDLDFFGPLGFAVAPAGRVSLPGPVDPGRVLWTALTPGGLDGLAGPLRPRTIEA